MGPAESYLFAQVGLAVNAAIAISANVYVIVRVGQSGEGEVQRTRAALHREYLGITLHCCE